ncbi:Wadjet anti-phage system protein JetD domain-containing protein [Arcobacter sp. YIC-80]|uniref:Wadjet anti-phage system protein JetD domain-containing protein n=1 Tax=Arcobacter sp. YIC-80 TaxID=3376683 RepID=UPI00385125C9
MNNNLLKAFENPHISKILNEVLDKFDKQAKRANKISFVLNDKNFLALYFPTEFNEDIDLEFDIKVLLDNDIFELKNASKKDEFLPLVEKRNAKLIFKNEKEDLLREIYKRPKLKSQKQLWSEELKNYFKENSRLFEILEKSPFFIEKKTNKEVLEKLKVWVETRDKTKLQRHESAKCFWGMSKIFDNKTDFCEYFDLKEKPVLLQVFGKSVSASKILFIENLETFTSCIESKNKIFDECILINAHGYKATAKRLRVKDGSKLFFNNGCKLNKETKDDFISWFYSNQNDKEVYFWGDLDFEGISILEKLQRNFTSLKAFIPAYDLMIKEALDGNSHFCEDTNKQNQKLVTSTLCKYTNDELIPFLKEKKLFLDQEFVDIGSI